MLRRLFTALFGSLFLGWRLNQPPGPVSILDTPLLNLTPVDPFTVRMAVENILVTGQIGSGKSTGSIDTFLRAMLSSKAFGGALILCVKVDDAERAKALCDSLGRECVMFGPDYGHTYDALAEAAKEPTATVVGLSTFFEELSEACARGASSTSGVDGGEFFKDAAQRVVKNAITLLFYIYGTVSVPDLYDFISTLPATPQELNSEQWLKTKAGEVLTKARDMDMPLEKHLDRKMAYEYCMREWPRLGDKQRGAVLMWALQPLDLLMRAPFRQLFSGESTLTPKDILDGDKVVIVDCPVLSYGVVGAMANCIWKWGLQNAAQRRIVTSGTKAVLLAADEYQYCASSRDVLALSTSRSSRLCHILGTQSMSGLENALGQRGEVLANALTACMSLKLFHASSDTKTAVWLSEMIGKIRLLFGGASLQQPDRIDWNDRAGSLSTSFSEHTEYELNPGLLSRLQTGGPPAFISEAIAHQSGRIFRSTGTTWVKVAFRQNV